MEPAHNERLGVSVTRHHVDTSRWRPDVAFIARRDTNRPAGEIVADINEYCRIIERFGAFNMKRLINTRGFTPVDARRILNAAYFYRDIVGMPMSYRQPKWDTVNRRSGYKKRKTIEAEAAKRDAIGGADEINIRDAIIRNTTTQGLTEHMRRMQAELVDLRAQVYRQRRQRQFGRTVTAPFRWAGRRVVAAGRGLVRGE